MLTSSDARDGRRSAWPRSGLSATVADQLIRMIFRNSKRVIVPLLITSVLCCVLLLDSVDPRALALWFALSWGATAMRVFGLSRLVRREDSEPTRKLVATAALSVLTGSAFASILLFFPSIGAFERAMLTALLISICSGAVIINAGYRPVCMSFVLPILGTLALLWALNPGAPIGDALARFIGATLLLMIVTLAVMAQDTFDAFAISVEWSVRQERLTGELTAALAETETARTAAETSSQSKTRFLAAASHDLRQPVHVLSLYGAVLSSADMSDKARRVIEQMNVAVESLAAQLNSLLDLSRLDSGDVEPEVGIVDLTALMRTLAEDFGKVADERGITLVNELEHPLFVRTDADMLSRILRNLCGNALKYTVEGSVTLRARADSDAVTLSISDTGIGIAEHDREHIFDEFYQASNTGRDASEGLGLGLSIVQRLVDALEHEIDVRSAHGEGTTVSLRMARCRVEAAGTSVAVRAAGARSARLPPGLWVHVVDDDAAVRDSMRTLLAEHGCRVTVTDGVSSTLAFLRDASPAVILVDMRLGGEASGLELIASARELRPRLPAALITAETLSEHATDGGWPNVPVLRKPLTEAVLVRGIETLVARPTASV